MTVSSVLKRLFRVGLLPLVLASIVVGPARTQSGDELRRAGSDGIRGSLVVAGGGELPDAVFQEFLARSGGEAARIVVIPTASRDRKDLDADEIWQVWHARGAASVAVLHTRSRERANDASFYAPLRSATGAWFGGGAQSRLAEAYLGTAVETELYALLARGGVIGGTSAGAAIQTRTMIARGNPQPEIAVGFDLLPGSVIDQHFLTRNRRPRLVRAIEEHPGLVGFGIDEGTALLVDGRALRVLGRSTVTVYLAQTWARPGREIELKPGAAADLTKLLEAARERGTLGLDRHSDYERTR